MVGYRLGLYAHERARHGAFAAVLAFGFGICGSRLRLFRSLLLALNSGRGRLRNVFLFNGLRRLCFLRLPFGRLLGLSRYFLGLCSNLLGLSSHLLGLCLHLFGLVREFICHGCVVGRLGFHGHVLGLHRGIGGIDGSKVNVAVDHYGLELCEGLVHKLFHKAVGGERNLVVAAYEHPLAGVDIDTFAGLHLRNLERSEPFHLHQLVLLEAFGHYGEHIGYELLGLFLRKLVLLCHLLGQVGYQNLCHELLSSILYLTFHLGCRLEVEHQFWWYEHTLARRWVDDNAL